MTSLYNEAYKRQEQRDYKGAMQLFEQALAQSSSAMDRMVTKYAMALCIWESAGLELEGKVYALVPGNLPAAEAAQKLWEDVVNIYHQEVKENAAELARWPFRGGSAHQMCKDAVSASFRAYSAIERVRKVVQSSEPPMASARPQNRESRMVPHFCTSCGAPVHPQDRFCNKCGTATGRS